MVTQSQVANADPVYQNILKINATITAVNAAVGVGYTGPITVYIGGGPGGNSTQIDFSAVSVPNMLNSLGTLANSTLTTLNSQLAAI